MLGQKNVVFSVVGVFSELGTKKNGFTVFSEPGTKKTMGLLSFLSSGQKWRS